MTWLGLTMMVTILFFTPLTFASTDACENLLTIQYAHMLTSHGGLKIAYMVSTPRNWNGRTIVFIAGLSRNMNFWEVHAEHEESRGYRVVRLDALNIGETLRASGVVHKPTLDDDARALANVLREARIKGEVILVGHSRGAAVALTAAGELEESGVDVKGVVASNPYVEWLTDYYERRGELNPITRSWAEALFPPSSMARQFLQARPREEIPSPPLAFDYEVGALSETLYGMAGSNIFASAQKIKVPVMILHAENELEPKHLIKDLAGAIKNSTLEMIGRDHLLPTASTSVFLSVIDDFLDKVSAPALQINGSRRNRRSRS